MALESLRVFVETPDGTQLEFLIKPTDTVEDVKDRIEATVGIPQSGQLLTFGTKLLEDESTLDDYGVTHDSVLKLRLKPEPTMKLVANPRPRNGGAKVEPNPDMFGKIIHTSYKTDYSGDNNESFLVEKLGEKIQKFNMKSRIPKAIPKK